LGAAVHSADVVIEFSFHAVTPLVADLCAKNKKALVIGTTGHTDADKAAMVKLMETMAASPSWAEQLKSHDWAPILLTGDAYATFLAEDTERITGILKALGLA